MLVALEDINEKEFRIKVTHMRSEKLVVGVEYVLLNPENGMAPGGRRRSQFKRVCQFSQSYASSLHIEEGQEAGVSLEQGQLVIRNVATNDGRIFEESIGNNPEDWQYTVLIGL